MGHPGGRAIAFGISQPAESSVPRHGHGSEARQADFGGQRLLAWFIPAGSREVWQSKAIAFQSKTLLHLGQFSNAIALAPYSYALDTANVVRDVNPLRSHQEIFHRNNSFHTNDLRLFHITKIVGIVVMLNLIFLK
jgi:hypothetical protein